MADKVKPRLDWKKGGSFAPFSFDDAAWEHMAGILQVSILEEDFKVRMINAAHQYAIDAQVDARPRASEKRSMLDDLVRSTENLHHILDQIDDDSKDLMVKMDSAVIAAMSQCRAGIKVIRSAAESAIRSMPDVKPGRPPAGHALANLVGDLTVLYTEITGRRPSYSGDVYNERHRSRYLDFMLFTIRRVGGTKHLTDVTIIQNYLKPAAKKNPPKNP